MDFDTTIVTNTRPVPNLIVRVADSRSKFPMVFAVVTKTDSLIRCSACPKPNAEFVDRVTAASDYLISKSLSHKKNHLNAYEILRIVLAFF